MPNIEEGVVRRKTNMRPRLILAALACAILTATTSAKPAVANSTTGYAKATKLLTQGKDFEQAIVLLQSAVSAQPKNSDYHLALGCAYADRAASLCHADVWQYHLSDGSVKHSKPPAWFHASTKDDGKTFNLSDSEAKARVAELGGSAIKEWQSAIALCHSSKERALAEHTEGWGLWALMTFDLESGPPIGTPPQVRTEMLKAFQSATRDDPSNAAYWESLAYHSSDFLSTDSKDFERALRLNPHNPGLWYTLFEAYWSESERTELTPPATQKAAAKQALKALQNCTAQDPKNAYPLYMLAYIKLDPTPYENNGTNSSTTYTPEEKDKVNEAIEASLTAADRNVATQVLALMDKAGGLSKCVAPVEEPPVPSLLIAPWRYDSINRSLNLVNNARLRALARDLVGLAIADAIERNLPGAVHAARADIRMGYQLAGSWPDKDTAGGSQTLATLVGFAIIEIGYANLIKVEQKYGTQTDLAKAKAELAAFKAKLTPYLARMNKIAQRSIYAMY